MNLKKIFDSKRGIRDVKIPHDDFLHGKQICDMARVCTSVQYNRVIYTDKDINHIGEPYFKYYNHQYF